MTPLVLITGFLGTGKTTLLQRLAEKHANDKLVYLVNEFSPEDVDGLDLENSSRNVVSVPGGSIFCKCVSGQFLHELSTIPRRFDLPGSPVAAVIIEASGIADPRVIREMFAESRLDRLYDLSRVICVVDPISFPKLLKTLPNVKGQVESADTVVLNKTDRADSQMVAEVTEQILELNPEVIVEPCQWANVDLDILNKRDLKAEVKGDYAECMDANYEHLAVELYGAVDAQWFEEQINRFADSLYRVKGNIPSNEVDGQCYHVDYSKAGISWRPMPGKAADISKRLVFIMQGNATSDLMPFAESLGEVIIKSAS